MNLNHDVLELVASFLELPDLLQLCCASHCLRAAAAPFMYVDVRVDTLCKLDAFAATIKRTPSIARRVKTFNEEVSAYRPFYAGVPSAQWLHYLTILMSVLDQLPALTCVALSISFDGCGDAHALTYRAELCNRIAALSRLQMLAVCDLDYDSLDLLDICPPLKALHLSGSHTEWTGAVGTHDRETWAMKLIPILERRHAHTLVELNMPYATFFNFRKFAHVRMPHVRTLVTPDGISTSPSFAKIFPALRHVRLNNQLVWGVDALDTLWPHLDHVELDVWQPGILNPGHHVRSLSVFLDGEENIEHFIAAASQHVEALRLRWDAKPLHFDLIIAAFPNLKYLNVPFTVDSLHRFSQKMRFEAANYPQTIEFIEFHVVVVPPPPAGWEPGLLPLDALRERISNLRAAALHWIDADFERKTRAWIHTPGGFSSLSVKDAAAIAAKYKFSMLWPRGPAFGPD